MSNKKGDALVIDLETNQELVRASLTLPAIKRFMKFYAQFGTYTRATYNGEEVK